MKFDFKIKRKGVWFTLYVLAVTLVFLYILFPSTALKIALTERLNQIHPDIRFAIAKLKPLLPPGVKLYQVNILYRGAPLLDLDTVKVTPDLLSLVGSRTKVKFTSRVYAGRLNGQAQLNPVGHPGRQTVDCRMAGIELQRITALKRLIPQKISGLLAGEFTYRTADRTRSLTAHLTVTDSRLELADPLFNQQVLEFKAVDASVALKNETLTVKKCRLKGGQLDAEISGTIGLGDLGGQRALNLKGSVTPHHVLMAQIKNSLPAGLLKGVKTGRQAIGFKIGGTLDDPGLSLN